MNLQTPLSELMTTQMQTVEEYDTMEAVARIFEQHDVHHVPVRSGKGDLLGIVSKSDFLKISFGMSLFGNPEKDTYNKALYKTTLVRDVMTRIVVTLEPDDTVETAAKIFQENLFHAIPIVSGKRLLGIVTTYDLLNFAFRKQNYTSIEGEAYRSSLD